MGTIQPRQPVTLVCGVLISEPWLAEVYPAAPRGEALADIRRRVAHELTAEGFNGLTVADDSGVIPFNTTHYYDEEMGSPILRQWFAFSPPVSPERLWLVKLVTNRIEQHFFSRGGGRRAVNLDPGYVEPSKLVLWSTKNHAHRIYQGDGIFAEVTLTFRDRAFHPLAWTYPDYRSAEALRFFGRVRETLTHPG